jgi:uncharacterized protein (TIGR02284 family)
MPGLKIQSAAMLARRANHHTLQFAGFSRCELQQFAFHLVLLEGFTQARPKSAALGGKPQSVYRIGLAGDLQIDNCRTRRQRWQWFAAVLRVLSICKKQGAFLMNIVDILDRLITISIDSEKRYRHAAKDVERMNLEKFFEWQALNRKAAADDLRAEREKIKGGANEHGTLAGLADRAALDFSVVMSKGDTGVIEWCREDDEVVIAEYEKALAEKLPEQIRLMLERQLERVRGAVGKLEGILRVFGKPRS